MTRITEVSSIGRTTGYVFVRFDKQVQILGWADATAQSCSPDDLVLIEEAAPSQPRPL